MVDDYFYDVLKTNAIPCVMDVSNCSFEQVGTTMSNLLKETEETMRELIVKDQK
jgi:hypothetical protein